MVPLVLTHSQMAPESCVRSRTHQAMPEEQVVLASPAAATGRACADAALAVFADANPAATISEEAPPVWSYASWSNMAGYPPKHCTVFVGCQLGTVSIKSVRFSEPQSQVCPQGQCLPSAQGNLPHRVKPQEPVSRTLGNPRASKYQPLPSL